MLKSLVIKIIPILLLTSIALNAKELVCFRKATLNVDTGKSYEFTLEEAKSNPFYLKEKNSTILLRTKSGVKYEYTYYKDTSDFKHYKSVESNTHLRKMTAKKGLWLIDMNSNGEMLSTLLTCGR